MKQVSRIVAAGLIVCLSILAIFSFVLIFGQTDEVVEGYGNVIPLRYTDIAPELSGIITAINIRDGDSVSVGDTLVLISDDEHRYAAQQAQLFLDQALSELERACEQYRNLDESESFETSAELANLRRARLEVEYYKSDYKRTQALFDSSIASQQQLERAKFQYDMALEYLLADR